MCMDGVSLAVLNDERIQQAMSNPQLDFVHQQVLLMLYSMNAAGSLNEYQQVLPLYLSKDLSQCEEILKVLEQAGLISQNRGVIELTYEVQAPEADAACGCHMHA
jgi:hypothetical protein